jgi:hypothetical protein
MITAEIGFNAGKIWNLLNENGRMTVEQVIEKLEIPVKDYYMAVGWLAREDKVAHFEDDGAMIVCLK